MKCGSRWANAGGAPQKSPLRARCSFGDSFAVEKQSLVHVQYGVQYPCSTECHTVHVPESSAYCVRFQKRFPHITRSNPQPARQPHAKTLARWHVRLRTQPSARVADSDAPAAARRAAAGVRGRLRPCAARVRGLPRVNFWRRLLRAIRSGLLLLGVLLYAGERMHVRWLHGKHFRRILFWRVLL